ncbi:MAG TPA: zinc finger-like domain-containing protein [Candidatus Sulfotelmatobacter sp.]|nr:zinc finger-like domain-containing protein [Candidatus Sulfotelmatobacter sp.]
MKSILKNLPTESVRAAVDREDEPAFRALAKDLADPRLLSKPVSVLLNKNKIGAARFLEVWRDHHCAEAVALISPELPPLFRDIVNDARSIETYCTVCDGTGQPRKGSTTIQCPRCKGHGTVMLPGDKESRRFLLEISGLTGKRGPQAVIQQNFTLPTGSVERTTAEVGRILDSTLDIIDASEGDDENAGTKWQHDDEGTGSLAQREPEPTAAD